MNKRSRMSASSSSPPTKVDGFDSDTGLALDMHRSWNHITDEVWRKLDPALWEFTQNPWVVLQTIAREKLQRVSADPVFRKKVVAFVQARHRVAKFSAASSAGPPADYTVQLVAYQDGVAIP